MPHGGLHLVDVKGGVSVHHHFHVFVVVGEPRDADVLEVWVVDVFSYFLGPDAKKTFLVEIIVRVLSGPIGVFTSSSMVARMTSSVTLS